MTPPLPQCELRPGDYARAQASGERCVPLLVETFSGLSPQLVDALRAAAEWCKSEDQADLVGERRNDLVGADVDWPS